MYYRPATNFTVRTGTIFHRSQIVLHKLLSFGLVHEPPLAKHEARQHRNS
jgi:hypothetical protein